MSKSKVLKYTSIDTCVNSHMHMEAVGCELNLSDICWQKLMVQMAVTEDTEQAFWRA